MYQFFRIILRIFYFFHVWLFVFSCAFVTVLHVSCLFTNVHDYNSVSGFVFVYVHVNIEKDALINLMHTCLKSNNNASSKDL